jgi:Piwi domain
MLTTGASVHHPAPGMTTRPSIAAVVASLDGHMVRHAASVRVQQHRKDVIAELKSMVEDLLVAYYQANNQNKKPTRIIFLRDGVSEGQFKEVSHLYEVQHVEATTVGVCSAVQLVMAVSVDAAALHC